MKLFRMLGLLSGVALAVFAAGTGARAACATPNAVPLKSLSAGFEAWKAVAAAMGECGNFSAELDQEFATKQPQALAANPGSAVVVVG